MGKQPAVSFSLGEVAVGFISLVGLYTLSRYSYPAFHTVAELFSIVIGFSLFMLTWNSRRIIDNNYLVFIGIAYLFIASFDLIHTLAYKKIELFSGYGTNLPTQLWIAARYIESLTLLIAPFYIRRELRTGRTLAGYLALTLILLAAMFGGVFPDCYIDGVGLTMFKIISEYLISMILLGALILLLKKRTEFDQEVLILLVLSIITTIGSELSFTFYVGVFDISNLVGHFLKIISFYLIYKAIIETGLSKPYHLLFRNLKRTETELKKHTLLLEEANKELESFSYSVSHDLRAPLRAIDGYARMILRQQGDKFDENTKHQFDVIRSNVKTMGQLIDDLLALSRLGREALSLSRLNIEELTRNVWEELKANNPDRLVDLKICDIPPGTGDASLIKQVLVNILSNAIKFTGIREAPLVEVGGYVTEKENVYYVRDNGVGFDMQYHDKLFGVFQRLHSIEDYEGTGIGLAIVQRIIHRHGGRVWAESEKDKGATFYFSLPRSTGDF